MSAAETGRMPPRLDYVALGCRDVAALLALTDALELPRTPIVVAGDAVDGVALGEVVLLPFALGDGRLEAPERVGVDHLGFATDEVGSGAAVPVPRPLVPGQYAPASDPGTGLRLGPALPRSSAPGTDGASGFARRLDHVGIASADNVAAEALLCADLGLAVESRQTDVEIQSVIESFTSDRYGVVHHARTPRAVGGLRVNFIEAGDCELELLQELDPVSMEASRALVLGGEPGTTRQDQGAIGRFIARRGPGPHHLAIHTPDIDATLSHLHDRGLRLIDRCGRPGSRRSRIGFVHPAASGGVLVHFVERTSLDHEETA